MTLGFPNLSQNGIQYTLANPNRGVSIKKKSVPISEFVRISEVIHLYGEFCSESL